MNTLVYLLFCAILVGGCVSGGLLGPNEHSGNSVDGVGSQPDRQYLPGADATQGWTGPVYSGPTAIPAIRGDGTIAETAEVAAARASHLAALEFARATNPDMDDGQYDPYKYGDHRYGVVSHAEDINKNILFYESLSQGHYGQRSGNPAANAEAAQWQANNAGAADAAAPAGSYGPPTTSGGYPHGPAGGEAPLAPMMAKNAAAGNSYGGPNMPYFGALAMLQVLPSGFLADTHEVAAARNTHLSVLAEAEAAAQQWRQKHAQQQHWS